MQYTVETIIRNKQAADESAKLFMDRFMGKAPKRTGRRIARRPLQGTHPSLKDAMTALTDRGWDLEYRTPKLQVWTKDGDWSIVRPESVKRASGLRWYEDFKDGRWVRHYSDDQWIDRNWQDR